MEGVPGTSKKKKKNRRGSEVESDWEEVQDMSQMPLMDMKNSTLNDLQIKVDLPNRKGDPKDKKAVDIEAVIKRRLNRDIKENQMSLHKVHLTSLFANGFLTNQVLSDGYLMGLALKLLPNETCYPSGPTSVKYFEAISKWYKSAVSLKDQSMVLTKKKLKKKPPLKLSLAIQMTYKHAVCKRDFIFIFIIILRAMGIDCRLVMNLQPLPMKPPQTELHKIVMKRPSNEKSSEAESKSKKSKLDDDYDSDISEESKKKPAKKTTSSKKSASDKSTSKSEKNTSTTKSIKKKESKPSTSKAASKSITKESKPSTSKANKSDSKSSTSKANKSDSKANTSKANTSKKEVSKEKSVTEKKNTSIKKDTSTAKAKKESTKSTLNVEEKTKRRSVSKSPAKLEAPKRASRRTSTGSTSSLNVPARRAASRSPSPNLKVEDTSKTNRKTTTKVKKEEEKSLLNIPVKRVTRSKSPSPLKVSPKFLKKEENIEKEAKPKVTRKKKEVDSEAKPKATKKAVPQIKISSTALFGSKGKAAEKPSTSKAKATASTSASKPARATTTGRAKKMEQVDGAMDYFSSSDDDFKICQLDGADDSLKLKRPNLKRLNQRRIFNPIDSDDDFVKTPQKKPKKSPMAKSVDRRVFSSDEDKALESSKTKCDFWVEVFCEEEEIWMPIDLLKGKVNNIEAIQKQLTCPINYVYGWNADQTIKDVTARYSKDWSNVVRKHRVDPTWLDDLLEGQVTNKSPRDTREDALMKKFHLERSLPTAVSDYKNHPLYALDRHLLKFEAIYPPNPPTMGFVRGEPVYARECVHTLHSREIWLKSARTVKLGEKPYKIVKARPKWNKLTNEVIKDQPLEVFGFWQTQEYEPPVAENGIVPRNAYGNVELFKTCMLPIGTVHLQLPGLNRVCKKLRIDCAPAVVGFDFHGGWSHPMYDGFVVCKEFEQKVIDEWNRAEDEYEKKEEEKYQERVWGNWKKLIKAMLIREKLKLKYNFDQFIDPETKKKTSKK
ncbi:XPC family protein [Megaselia abdita]